MKVKKRLFPAVLVIAALLAGNLVVMLDSANAMAGDTKKKKPPFIEHKAGVIPSVYGDLVNVAGSNRNYILTFKDDDGTLRIIEVQAGNKLPRTLTVIERKY